MTENRFSDDLGKLLLRLTVGVLMLFHGVTALLQPGIVDILTGTFIQYGLPEAMVYALLAAEVAAPLMIILGIYVRAGALLLALSMMVALWLQFSGVPLQAVVAGGQFLELQVLYLLGALSIALLGSGRFALRPTYRFKTGSSPLSAQPLSTYG